MSIRLEALPALDDAIAQLEQLAAAQGISFTIANFGGYRTAADTALILGYRDADYAVYAAKQLANGVTPIAMKKWRPIATYGNSFHDYGGARDLAITAKPYGMSDSDALEVLGQLAPSAGLRWGGSFNDPAHFELPVPIGAVAAAWAEYSGSGSATPATSASSSSSSTAAAFAVVAAIGIAIAIVRDRHRRRS